MTRNISVIRPRGKGSFYINAYARGGSKRHQKKNLVHLALCCGGPVSLGMGIHNVLTGNASLCI